MQACKICTWQIREESMETTSPKRSVPSVRGTTTRSPTDRSLPAAEYSRPSNQSPGTRDPTQLAVGNQESQQAETKH